MADGAFFSLDEAQFDRDADRLIRDYLSAGTRAVSGTTKGLEHKLEELTKDAVPGRLWRAWASESYPRTGPARNPAGEVYLNGGERTKGAVEFWTQPGEIRGKSGQYLAIPLPAAGSRGRKRDLTPGEWERRTGVRLRFVYREGKPSLLVAPGGATNARTGGFRQLTGGKRGRAAQGRGGANPLVDSVIPIFVLLPMVPFRNAFAIAPTINASDGELARAFFAEVGRLR